MEATATSINSALQELDLMEIYLYFIIISMLLNQSRADYTNLSIDVRL